MSERTVCGTVDRMIEAIPEGEEMREKLIRFKADIFMELPERNNHLWAQLLTLLQSSMPKGGKEDLNEWQLEVALILRGDK